MSNAARHHPTWSEVRPQYMSSILTPINATCLTCHYFQDRSDEDDAIARGLCRRHAPCISGWPSVTEDDYCGDWRTDYRPLVRNRDD